jgi:hypothetical protein
MDCINLVLFGYLFIIHVQIPLYKLWQQLGYMWHWKGNFHTARYIWLEFMDSLAYITVRKITLIIAGNPSSERMETNLYFVAVSQEYNLVCMHKTSVFLKAEPTVYRDTISLAITTRNDTSVVMFTFSVTGISVFLQIVRESFTNYCHV